LFCRVDAVFESDLRDGYITFSSSHSFVLILGMALIMGCIDFSEAMKLEGYMLIFAFMYGNRKHLTLYLLFLPLHRP